MSMWPQFAAGCVYTSSLTDLLLASLHTNPRIVELVQLLMMGQSEASFDDDNDEAGDSDEDAAFDEAALAAKAASSEKHAGGGGRHARGGHGDHGKDHDGKEGKASEYAAFRGKKQGHIRQCDIPTVLIGRSWKEVSGEGSWSRLPSSSRRPPRHVIYPRGALVGRFLCCHG